MMYLRDLNPFVRFASQIHYKNKDNPVFVRDARLFYILSGNGEIVIENKHYTLYPDSVFYCAAESCYNITSENGMSLLSLNFDLTQNIGRRRETAPPFPVSEAKKAEQKCPIVSDSSFLNTHIFISNGAEFLSQTKNITEEFASQRIYYQEKCSSLLHELLIDIHRVLLRSCENAADTVNFIISYINKHFFEELENKSLAALSGYHEYHLNRLFFSQTGMSMHKYILNLRMNEAKRLLLNTALPLNVIAEKVGFRNNTHFSSYFKKVTGLSPSRYRNSFQNNV